MADLSPYAKTLEKALSLWETFINTRQSAYERKMDKNDKKALAYAAEAFRILAEKDIDIEDKDFNKAKEKFFKYRGKI